LFLTKDVRLLELPPAQTDAVDRPTIVGTVIRPRVRAIIVVAAAIIVVTPVTMAPIATMPAVMAPSAMMSITAMAITVTPPAAITHVLD
jgi:hypothetical protein